MYLFFFFKQKTAYEMRISDWSSDVCSSDLLVAQHLLADRRLVESAERGADLLLAALELLAELLEHVRLDLVELLLALLLHQRALTLAVEIGRASCRERGCQYV